MTNLYTMMLEFRRKKFPRVLPKGCTSTVDNKRDYFDH